MEQLAETQSAILMKSYINEVADHKCHRLAGNEDARQSWIFSSPSAANRRNTSASRLRSERSCSGRR